MRCLILTIVTAGACAAQSQPPTGLPTDAVPLEVQHLLADQYSGIAEPRRAVIRDAMSWAAFWKEALNNRTPEAAVPPVDFAREMVIVAAMGRRGTGGYGISIEGAYHAPGRIVVAVRQTSPPAGAMTVQVFTAPVDVVRVQRSAEPIAFLDVGPAPR